MLDQVRSKTLVLFRDGVLANIRQEYQRDQPTEDAQRTGNIEWILALLDDVVASSLDDVGENVVADECTNFAACSGYAVIHTSYRGGRSLRGQQADVVAGADLAEC